MYEYMSQFVVLNVPLATKQVNLEISLSRRSITLFHKLTACLLIVLALPLCLHSRIRPKLFTCNH